MRLLQLLSFLFLACGALAQHDIQGRVSDATTGMALPGANIFIPELKQGGTSDANGRFVLKDLPAGKYTLVVSFMGYQPQNRLINPAENRPRHNHFALEPEVITTQEVTVNASRGKNLLEAVPARVEVIEAKRLEGMPVQNAEGLLQTVPGIQITNTLGIFGTRTTVSLRGLGGNEQSRTLVLLDDIPLNKADGGSVNWNMINKDMIGKVVVLKGPGSALYGSNAMGGIINFITRTPEKPLEGRIQTGYGSYNTVYGGGNLAGKLRIDSAQSFIWNLDAFGRKSDGYVTIPEAFLTEPDDTTVTPTFLQEIKLGARAGYQFKSDHFVELSASLFDDRRGSGIRVFDELGANQQHDTYLIRARYRGKLGKALVKSFLFVQAEHYQRLYEYMNEGEYRLYSADSKRRDMGLSFQLSRPLRGENHNLTAGFDLRKGSVDAADTYYTSTDIIYNQGEMSIGSAYLQDEMHFPKRKLELMAGIRFDYAFFSKGMFRIETPSYSIAFMEAFNDTVLRPRFWSAFSPKFNLRYSPREGLRFYLSAGKGFGAPILDDMCRSGKRQNTFKLANPDLQPERLFNMEIGFDATLFEGASIQTSAYFSEGKEFMYFISNGDTVNMGYKLSPVQIRDNIGRVVIYGLEGGFRMEVIRDLELYTNYAFTHSQIREYKIGVAGVDTDLTGKYLAEVPRNKASLGGTWSPPGFSIGLHVRFTGKRWINETNEVDDEYLFTDQYPNLWEWGIKFRKTIFRQLETSLSIENLSNRRYINDSGQQSPGRMAFWEISYSI